MDFKIEKIKGGITAVGGLEAAGVSCGIKKNGNKDLALLFCPEPVSAAGVFTTNRFKAPPLLVTEKHLKNPIRAVVINSGNANACTGEQGYKDALTTCRLVAEKLGLKAEEVLVSSTGVIGVYLPMEKIARGIEQAVANLSRDGGKDAALAIMTTDTVPKEVALKVTVGERSFVLAGMAKGSGMICPDLATMLAFIATDLRVKKGAMLRALKEAVAHSFNLITVDGDTSTNDLVLLLSTGNTQQEAIDERDFLWGAFQEALLKVCRELARMIVLDGEGATKLIRLVIRGASDYNSARKLSRAILNSCLVKTAFFGEDANWGRIITAMGYSGVDFYPERVDIYLGEVQVTAKGTGLVFDEERAKAVLRQREVPIFIDLHMGETEITALGCDLSYDYVTINSAYRS